MKWIALIGILLATPVHAANLYDLQSHCGQQAAALVARVEQQDRNVAKEWGEKTFDTHYQYENNYSTWKQGCFVHITATNSQWSPDNSTYSSSHSLYDASTGQQLGFFHSYSSKTKSFGDYKKEQCEFNEVECSGKEEWLAKMKPYLHNE